MSGVFVSVTISDPFVCMGHLDSVKLTATNTTGGSKTGDDLFFGEHLYFG